MMTIIIRDNATTVFDNRGLLKPEYKAMVFKILLDSFNHLNGEENRVGVDLPEKKEKPRFGVVKGGKD